METQQKCLMLTKFLLAQDSLGAQIWGIIPFSTQSAQVFLKDFIPLQNVDDHGSSQFPLL